MTVAMWLVDRSRRNRIESRIAVADPIRHGRCCRSEAGQWFTGRSRLRQPARPNPTRRTPLPWRGEIPIPPCRLRFTRPPWRRNAVILLQLMAFLRRKSAPPSATLPSAPTCVPRPPCQRALSRRNLHRCRRGRSAARATRPGKYQRRSILSWRTLQSRLRAT